MADPAAFKFCPSCGAPLESTTCARCGQASLPSSTASSSPPAKWYYNVWFVLAMLFFVLGPFGLPLVWKNPKFSRWVKIILTLAMVVYTVLLIHVTITTVRIILKELTQFNAAIAF